MRYLVLLLWIGFAGAEHEGQLTRLARRDPAFPLLPADPKEAPADAEAVSHKLIVRAGLARQLGAGLWTFLPAGWRAHRRVEQIIREELDAIGAGRC